MRFNIRIDAIWRAPLLVVGATPQNCYVILGDDGMHFRFGWGFNRTIPYDQVAAIFPRSWPILYGVGVRSNLRGVIGLTGSFHDVVEVRLKKRAGNWAVIYPVDRIAVSLEEPEEFIAELSLRTGLAEPPDINALTKPTRRPTEAKRTADSGQRTADNGQSSVVSGQSSGKANGAKAVKKAPARKASSRKRPVASAGPKQNGAYPKPPAAAKASPARAAGKKTPSASAKANGSVPKPAAPRKAPAAKKTPTASAKASGGKPSAKGGAKPAAKKAAAASAKANGAKAPARKPVARKRTGGLAVRARRPSRRSS
jgi:hypothetical protein